MAHIMGDPGVSRPKGLYALDARCKLAAMACVSIGSLFASPAALLPATVLIVGIVLKGNAFLWRFFRETRFFFVLLGCILISRSLTTPGDAIWTLFGVAVTRQGLYEGGMMCWRLFLIVVMSMGLALTTRSIHIRWAVQWCLFMLPQPLRVRISTMIGLLLRFIPVVLMHSRDIGAAQKARGIENRKNPFYRMMAMAAPLLRRVFIIADKLVMAMESRCYGEQRSAPDQRMRRNDFVFLCAAFTLGALLFFL